METIAKKLYEGMFLVDSAEAAADWDKVETSIKNILGRAEVEIVSAKKWDERKLAYEIGGKSRGTYILCYFRADGERIRDIERDVQLSELIMRVLILSAEHITQEGVEKETPAMLVERQKREAAEAAVKVAGPEQASAEQASAEQASAEQASVEQASVEQASAMTDTALEVSEEGAEESAASQSDSESDKTDVEAEARESEEPQADEMKAGSESADEQDAEKNEEK